MGVNGILIIYIYKCKVPNFSMYERVFQLNAENIICCRYLDLAEFDNE